MSKQVILVTGASSGFGLMTAQSLAQASHTVYASMRETEGRNAPQVAAIAAWAAEQKADLRTVELDVQSEASAQAGVAAVIADTGRLDVIVHNAGHMVFGPAEAFTPDQYTQQYDVNVMSAQRVSSTSDRSPKTACAAARSCVQGGLGAFGIAAMQDHLVTLLDQNPGRHQSKTVGRTRSENLGHV
jgi:NAD(P)-dependent dehydrogenase (short-subunit alcohol dehydrogenase family)